MKYVILLFFFTTMASAQIPTTLPATAPSGLDAGTWEKMKAIDARAGAISSLTADFSQKKTTALLKKPIISSGNLSSKGSVMLWETKSSPSTIMRIDEKEIELYYPNEKTEEIYAVQGQISGMISSPVPRLSQLIGRFDFALAPSDNPAVLALRLTPIDATIKQHVQSVTVSLDAERGVIVNFVIIDRDDDKSEIQFSNIKANVKIDDSQLQLKLPADVKVVHPLDRAPQ